MASRSRKATGVRSKRPSGPLKPQVSRKWSKKTRLISPSISSDSDSEPNSPTSPSPGFQGFMSLPVDVFVNIASYFQPQDVLALSRVNSFLRRLLMSCKAEPIWRSARLNFIGLPPCPKALSEPAYAARLFSKICTFCGERALQNMDPILLERLCRKCKDAKLIDVSRLKDGVDISLVLTSTTILPGYFEDYPERGPWCFSNDIQTVKTKLAELNAAGDKAATEAWIEQRQGAVEAREQSAEPLIDWLHNREMEREVDLERRRLARQVEIKNRLMGLGCDERDMEDFGDRFHQVHNASPLTDKTWRELLPELLVIVEANRCERIESEREERSERISDWAWDICAGKVFDLAEGVYDRWQSLNATSILLNGIEKHPAIKPLLDEDPTDNEFEQMFESRKSELASILINWVDEQEAALVSMMPSDTSVADFTQLSSKFETEFVIDSDEDRRRLPITDLPSNTQKLLRADAVFIPKPEHTRTRIYTCFYYPNFDDFPDAFTYSKTASEIVMTFLACLGRPNASHLEMTSAGRVYDCGFCPELGSLFWKEFVDHCLKVHWTDETEDVLEA